MAAPATLVATCGNGHFGRLGHGLAKSASFFRIVGSLVGYSCKQVACGGSHTAVVTEDGSLFTFGLNDKGQLGHSEHDKFVPVPIEVGLPDPVTHVAAGDHHTICITSAGEVWAWGSHEAGQLGIGPSPGKAVHKVPRLVKALSGAGVQQLAAGAEHSLALGPGLGQVWAWGASANGALGTGAARGREIHWEPTLIGGPLRGLRLLQVTAGLYSSGCVDDAGRAWTWGHGIWHQLGHGTAQNEMVPRQVSALRNVGSLALGHQSSWALTRDGRAFCWGSDDHGSLGQGTWQKVPLAVPQELKSLPPAKAIATKWQHAMAISRDGGLYTWGCVGGYDTDVWGTDGGGGQLGLGDGKDHWEPTHVKRLHTSQERFYDLRMPYIKPWKALQVACGRNHSAMMVQVHLDLRDVQP